MKEALRARLIRTVLGAGMAVCACASCAESMMPFPVPVADSWVDPADCDAPELTLEALEEIATQILAGLPRESDPSAEILKATCVPRGSSSFEIPNGPIVDIPDEDIWVFVAQGYHAPGPPWPAVFEPNYGRKSLRASGIDIGRLSKGSRTEQTAKPQEASPPSARAYGYYLVLDESGRATGYGVFGPPATIAPAE